MADQPVVMNVPNDLLNSLATAAVIKAFPPHVQEELVRSIVEHSLTVKTNESYGRRTVMEAAVSKMIQEEAIKQCQTWVEEMRPAIAKRVREEIKRRGYVDTIFEAVLKSLGEVRVSVSIGSDR